MKSDRLILAIITFVAAVIVATCSSCSDKPDLPPSSSGWDTSRGVRIIGVLAPDEVDIIHGQLDQLDAAARAQNLLPIPQADFVIELVPVQCSEIGFFTTDGQCVAGQYHNPTLTPSSPRERIRVTREGLRASDPVVKYEGEHWTLWYRNRQRFWETASHPPPHPIF
jgi:hypothetical protein